MSACWVDDIDLPEPYGFDLRLLVLPRPNPDLLALLDTIRADVVRGHIIGLAVITACCDGGAGSGYVRGRAPIASLIAGANYLLPRLVQHAE